MPEINDAYKTISKPTEGEFRDRGSKFIAYAFEVKDEEEIKERLEEVKSIHPKARHYCYAYQLGLDDDRYRANDDGEPNGSAGLPILNTIKSFEITDALIVVVRYFGGTLLGVSGLINAYKSAAIEALSTAKIIEKTVNKLIHIRFEYPQMNDIMQFVKTHDITIKEQT
ncbi:MAG: YigZ family protein, partial [Spirosomaceae bacterium]|nr:YigZ family protein [Spirosomataceae bacterium]